MAGNVLITGINSFTGPYIATELASRGHRVFGLSQEAEAQTAITMLKANLLNREELAAAVAEAKPDYVIHLAAITFVPHGNIAEMYLTNVVGTRNLLEALTLHGKSHDRVLLASSANVYGNAVEGMLDENTPFAPANDYAASKVAMELMAGIWTDHLPIAIVRPFNYTGAGQADKFLIPKIVGHFRQNRQSIELGNIDVVRDFSDVRFVAQAYAELLEKAQPGEAYNICSGRDYSLKDVVAAMNKIAGYDIEIQVNPDFVRTNDVRRLVGDNNKLLHIARQLQPIDLEETLAWMYRA